MAGGDVWRLDALNWASPDASVFCSPRWYEYQHIDYRPIGVYKGDALVAGACVPVAGGAVPAVVNGTPWSGPVCRTEAEGERLAVAQGLAEYLRGRWGSVSLTLPPTWTDVRGFLWDGWRSHVRYTYRGSGQNYEKRVRVRRVDIATNTQAWSDAHFEQRSYYTGEDSVTALFDCRNAYYWRATGPGEFHTELVDRMLEEARTEGVGFDMVGCNSPRRSLFKRSFGGRLTPYYHVTTGDPAAVGEFWGERRPVAA